MKTPGIISTTLAILLLAAACGLADGGEQVRTEGPPPVVLAVTPAQPPATPPTTTTVDTTTASEAPPDSVPTSPNEPGLPPGAHHGDQAEVVEHFGAIASDGDCDHLRVERDADRMARDQMLAQRAADQSARGKAEMADRWMQAAQGRMRTLRCPAAMAVTP